MTWAQIEQNPMIVIIIRSVLLSELDSVVPLGGAENEVLATKNRA
jgi:hypothetical protein